MVVRTNCAIVLERRFCSVGAPKNANRQSLESFDSKSVYSLTPIERSRSRDEFSTFGTCASGAEFEASVQHTLEDTNGAQLSEFQFMLSVVPPTRFG